MTFQAETFLAQEVRSEVIGSYGPEANLMTVQLLKKSHLERGCQDLWDHIRPSILKNSHLGFKRKYLRTGMLNSSANELWDYIEGLTENVKLENVLSEILGMGHESRLLARSWHEHLPTYGRSTKVFSLGITLNWQNLRDYKYRWQTIDWTEGGESAWLDKDGEEVTSEMGNHE